jgi:hypothetical protein
MSALRFALNAAALGARLPLKDLTVLRDKMIRSSRTRRQGTATDNGSQTRLPGSFRAA